MQQENKLQQNIQYLKGVGERRAKLFSKLGVDTVDALLRHYPRGYLDLRDAACVADAPLGEPTAVRATVHGKSAPARISGGRSMIRVHAGDETAELEILYFNNKYGPAALEVGISYIFYGKFTGTLLNREIINPLVIKPEEAAPLSPQYPLTEGLSSKIIATTVKNALDYAGADIAETLPAYILERYGLVGRAQAIRDIHFPADYDVAARAKQRLIFEELLTLQLGMFLLKSRSSRSTAVRIDTAGADTFVGSLPYALTGAQRRSVDEILRDISGGGPPMNRLLQGDVGSGKTVVAATAAYCAAKSGYQSAFMAPTELLANQHAETLSKLLAPFGVTVGLLTSSVKGKARTQLLEHIAAGEVDLVVGTHAVIGEAVAFKNLGFVVADEQHRFGVEQRNLLSKKGDSPHLLVMSATPIPRTLALIIYGDLDISVIDEMPPGRKKIRTFLVTEEYRTRYLGFVRKTVAEGHQAYIVCPLVEDSDALAETLSATEYKQELEQNYLQGIPVGLVHGRMKAKDKAEVMDAFQTGAVKVLVSTTVIEVGIDVPNATVMIIENAERFGLSALHQLRGRIGRGADESFCILVSSTRAETAQRRLEIMKKTDNGFEIARYDLTARGPGDFFGRRQHGLPELHIADLLSDETVLHDAADAAREILARDPRLDAAEFQPLKEQVERMFQRTGGQLN